MLMKQNVSNDVTKDSPIGAHPLYKSSEKYRDEHAGKDLENWANDGCMDILVGWRQ